MLEIILFSVGVYLPDLMQTDRYISKAIRQLHFFLLFEMEVWCGALEIDLLSWSSDLTKGVVDNYPVFPEIRIASIAIPNFERFSCSHVLQSLMFVSVILSTKLYIRTMHSFFPYCGPPFTVSRF